MLQLRPTFSESWYRVVNLRAKLRSSAQITRQYYRGERWYVVRDPAGNQFHRLSDAAYRFVGLLDGSRTVGEAWDLVGGQLDDEAPTQPEVIQILSQLHAANLLESDVSADATVLLRRHKQQMKRKMQGRLMNILFPRIPLWDPDRILKRWLPVVRPLMSPIGAIIWLIVVGLAIAMIIPRWSIFQTSYRDALSIATNPEKALYLWLMFWILKFIHEMGHAFSCRRFGGEVHEMGIMFLVFIPTPYVDASSAWGFPSRWARMFVGAGGMTIELFIAALMVFVWANTSAGVPWLGLPINELACDAIMIAGFTTVIFNANPLLRYDGYYMLSDWLEIPNLQQKSKDYLLGLIKRYIFRVKSQQPLPPVSQRLWLFFYGLASSAYRILVGITIILLVAYQVPVLGYLMAIGGILTWLIVPVVKIVKYLALEPELHRKRFRATAFVLAVAVAAIVLIGFIPWWVHVEAAGILEAQDRQVVNAKAAGFVTKILGKDGQWVKKDDVILVCTDPQLDTNMVRTKAMLHAAELKEQQDRSTDPAAARIDLYEIDTYKKDLAELTRQKNDLTVRAPIDGQLIAPELRSLPGRYIPQGQELLTVATMDKLIIRAALKQRDVMLVSKLKPKRDGKLQIDADPQVRLSGDLQRVLYGSSPRIISSAQATLPSATLSYAGGGDIAIDPSDPKGERPATAQFELKVDLANPQLVFMPGERAYVRLRVDRRPLIWQWYNRFLQLIESKSSKGSKLV